MRSLHCGSGGGSTHIILLSRNEAGTNSSGKKVCSFWMNYLTNNLFGAKAVIWTVGFGSFLAVNSLRHPLN